MTTTTTDTGVRIGVLGLLRAERDGIEADLGGRKQRAVLAVLVANVGRSVSRDQLLEGVWGEEASSGNRPSLYTYLSNLRALLGDVIVRTGVVYRLNISNDDVDAWRFEKTVGEARGLVATDPVEASRRLREALGLWRGRPYADLVDIPGLDAEVRRLEELRLEAVELRIDAELAAGLHETLIAELEALAEEHPLRERFRAQHMLALYRSGRQSEALRAYRATESLLTEELGVEPSHELQNLELQILEHDSSLLEGIGRTVTQRLAFLVTDIDGSTRSWSRFPQSMAVALATHDRVLREAIESAGGRVFKHTGDGVLAVFGNALEAAEAAEAAQQGLAAADWGEVGELAVRMGIDVGEADSRGGDFFGPPLNRAARLCSSGHGGQVLVSAAAQAEVAASAPAGVQIRQLGEYELRGMASVERVAQLVFVGLPADFPDLRLDSDSALGDRAEALSMPGYEVRDRIGEGALGLVWRAYQPSVGREVAIKVIRPELADHPAFVRRFEAEARTIARLAHPHIVPLIDFWRDGHGAYLVLQLLPGGSLAEALGGAVIPVDAARRILAQVGSALDHAHSQRVTHGDVKPGNVLLDSSGNAYLSDFGIAARLLDPGLVSSVSLTPEYRAPEEAVTGPTPEADRYAFGMLARALLPATEETEPAIARAMATLPHDRYPSAAALLAELDQGLGDLPKPVASVVTRNPYKGLRAFDEADRADFYGRDGLVTTLVSAVADRRFVTVVGPSGSGKSSVVQAGLLPALADGALPRSEEWFRIVVTPGSNPLGSVAGGLSRLFTRAVSPEDLISQGLAGLVAQILPEPDDELLVVIDQMEELYTLVDDPEQRRQFTDLLVGAGEHQESRVRVVATLRADFYDRPLQDARLGSLVRDGLVTVLPPGQAEFVEIIASPSQAVGLRWEPGLPHRIAQEVADQPGALPLLQYALTELVEQRTSTTLTDADYQRVGGVAGALATRAETVYASLQPVEQEAARQVLLRLVTVDEESDDTRRRVRRSELESLGIPRPDLDTVLDVFTTERLLLGDRDPVTRGPTFEVAHEALLREWPRLAGWVNEHRQSLIQGRRFRAAMSEWEAADRHPDYLLIGNRLAPYLGWAETASLTVDEAAYFQASRDGDETQRAARRRRRRTLTGVLAGAAAVATILGVLASVQAGRATVEADRAGAEADRALAAEARAEAEAERATSEARVARAGELSAAAQAVLDTDPALAKLLAVASTRVAAPSADTLSVLHQAYALDPVIDQYDYPRRTEYFTSDVHPDGTRLVASSSLPGPFGYLEVHDFDSGETVWSWESTNPSIAFDEARFSPDGSWVVSGSYWRPEPGAPGASPNDQMGIHIWDVESGELIRLIDLGRCGGKVHAMTMEIMVVTTLHPEECAPPFYGGHMFAAELVDIASGDRTLLSSDVEWGPESIGPTISSDGQYVAFSEGMEDGRFVTAVVELATGDRVLEFDATRPTQPAGARLLNHDGSLLIAGERPMEVWDVGQGVLVATFSGHGGQAAFPWAFSADGFSVYSVGFDSTLRIWDAIRGLETAAYPTAGFGRVSVTDAGQVLVTNIDAYRSSLLDLTPGEVWGVSSCGGFVHGQSLRIVDGHAAFNETCPGGESVTQVVDVTSRALMTTHFDNFGQDVAISADGSRLVRQEVGVPPEGSAGGADGSWGSPPRIRTLLSGELLVEFEGVCTWDAASAIVAWNQPGCAPFPTLPFPVWNEQLLWSPDSSLVVAKDLHGRGMAVWEAESGKLVSLLENPCRLVGPARIMFTASGEELLVSCIGDGLLIGYSTETWDETRSAFLADDAAGRETFGFVDHHPAQGLILGLGGLLYGGEAALHWLDDETLEVVHSIASAHAGPASSGATSPDGSLLATGSTEGLVKVWDLAGRHVTQEINVGSQVQGVAFIDNHRLAVTPQTGGFYVYTLDPDELMEIVRPSLHRAFTPAECARFSFGDECPALEELRGDG